MQNKSLRHIDILDPLRGIAALLVMLFHYSGSVLPTVLPNALAAPLSIGKSGVQIFFVISGFVIPFAMVRRGYGWNDLPDFMLRRYVRIAPPAYVAMLACVLYQGISIITRGHPVIGSVDWPGLGIEAWVGNIFFCAEYLDSLYYNFVYWTLGLEFQFYFFIGLLLPLLVARRSPWLNVALLLSALAIGLLPTYSYFRYGCYFTLGLALFLYHGGYLDRAGHLVVSAAACTAAWYEHDPIFVLPAVLTAGAIHFRPPIHAAPLRWLGKVSFSLYITHVPTAYFSEAVLKRVLPIHTEAWGKYVMLVVYVALALIVADLFNRWVERPALQWSQRLRVRTSSPQNPIEKPPALG